MKTSAKFMALQFFALVACLPLTSAFGQAPASTAKQQVPIIGGSTRTYAPFSPAFLATERKSQAALARGEAALKAGSLDDAMSAFQEALSYEPDNGLAYRRMAEAYTAAGKLPEASRAFHKFLVEGFGPGTNGGVVDTADEWAEYALVLVKTGQPAQAIRCYNHAAYLLDYEDSENHSGKPSLQVLLPELAAEPTSPEQVRYTPERLQALADTALAYEEWGLGSGKDAYAHTQEAVRLYPDSPVTHFYRGEVISGPIHSAEAKAEYQKSADLGDDQTAAAAKARMSVLR